MRNPVLCVHDKPRNRGIVMTQAQGEERSPGLQQEKR
jgi:hypothetical protein